MKLFESLTLLAAIAVARDALVIVPKADTETRSVSPNTARHILTQRLGLSSILHDRSEDTIKALNAYAAKPQPSSETASSDLHFCS